MKLSAPPHPPPSLRYVVWYYASDYDTSHRSSAGETYYLVFDWLPDGSHDLAVTRYVGDFYAISPLKLGDVFVVSPLGATRGAVYAQTCSGAYTNFDQVQHECRVDSSDAARGYPLLTFEYVVSEAYGDYSVLADSDAGLASSWADTYGATTAVRYVGDAIVRWEWDGNATTLDDGYGAAPSTLYDLFDYFDPYGTKDYALSALSTLEIACDGGAATDGIDYHHGSSINVGVADNYVVTLRNLNTVASFYRNGSGLQWTLSPTLTGYSDFAFADSQAMFYDPHDVTQLSATHLMLVDDGNTRANCSMSTGDGCFSRALELNLDFTSGVASVVWQFSYPDSASADGASWSEEEAADDFNVDGGSVEKVSGGTDDDGDGHYLVAFTKIGVAADDDVGRRCEVFEVDTDGAEVGRMVLPLLPSCCDNAGHYRALSATTVYGESSDSPF